jgi:signal transduction histidine kinase
MPLFEIHPPSLLETIFEEIGVGVAVVDRDQRLVFANSTALDLVETKAGGDRVRFHDWRQNFRIQDSLGIEIPIQQSAVMRALKGEKTEAQEVHVKMPDGDTKWILVWAYPFSTMGLDGAISLIMDETAEVELREAATHIRRMENLGTLAAGLAHDFNDILNTIAINIALSSRAQSCSSEVRSRLEQVSEAVNKAAALIKRLTQFSRTQELTCQTLQVNEVVHDVLRRVRPLLLKNISLVVDLADDLPLVYADSSQMEQVLDNLIVNALDAMPDGGTLKVSTSIAHQTQKSSGREAAHEFVRICVADSGIGIPGELQSAIFEPFFTTKPKGKGTGLGLSSSYGIVRQHKGKIEVQSEPGHGANFSVLLPAKQTVGSGE